MKKKETVSDVASWRMCLGCGACACLCPNKAISLVDIFDQGIRPKIDKDLCQKCGDCLNVCPGIGFSHKVFGENTIEELRDGWGPVLEVWEGYSSDDQMRLAGSSGGAVSALAIHCLESGDVCGVLHIGVSNKDPLTNISVFSTSSQEVISAMGSRYGPAAACERFDWIEKAEGKCVFIGKPCDVAALRKAQKINPELNEKVLLAISIFCAGTPSIEGTYKVLKSLGVEPDQVKEFRYRGCGWPGMTTAKLNDDDEDLHEMTYSESWGTILCNHVGLRCRLCPDGTGEMADISCGDPWYMDSAGEDPGQSLILIRTDNGREIFKKAIQDKVIHATPAKPEILPASQKWLQKKRYNAWGRLFSMRLVFIPVPHFKGFCLFSCWIRLSLADKIRSIAGTISRILKRKWYKPLKEL